MVRMSTAERLKVKNDLSRVLRKQLSSSQRIVLQKLGIYCHENGNIILDFDGFDDAILWQLRRELRNLVGSNPEGKGDDTLSKSSDLVRKDDDDVVDEVSKKALRVAILKNRFAETLLKANAGKSDPNKVQQERQKLEKLRREEEAKIKASIRKEKLRQEDELKRRRNKERESARNALELMERNVDVEDNFKVMQEFERLSQCCVRSSDCGYGPELALRELNTGKFIHPLERFGLRIKEEFMADDDDDCQEPSTSRWELEEGELLD